MQSPQTTLAVIDAEFEPIDAPAEAPADARTSTPEASLIRRAPHAALAHHHEAESVRPAPPRDAPIQLGRVSMDLGDWIEVDRTLHELYTLVEVAIQQRDDARVETAACAEGADAWQRYAQAMEAKLQAAHMANLELRHEARRCHDLVDEALQLGPFSGRRRQVLRERLEGTREP